ncbi:TetR/AcrR family transcriptional regulator [Maritimibacter sp. HL-12]|uniref:TetR/AcrR family transcriptional regulator n=1 Tax=Maritimibacter sp. HL-12 TaxID=1162418 RepID=UPI000A0EF485|nr:TetR/AcrR family transcriptional regulator [Maritimibacter sp. HL-12]SMH50219.1 transcriptional regulator, TetR family [Maritimibacter sp. HL-12]
MSQPRTRKSSVDRKAEIVDSAIRLSATIGPDRVTTQHLADAVGVTQPAIFRHFATKTDIWAAVGVRIVDEMQALHSHPVVIAQDDPHDRLKQLVGRHFVHIEGQPAIPAILFSRELHAENEPLRSRFSEYFAVKGAEFTRLITAAQAAGIHHAEIAAEDAAHLVTSAMQGISLRWLLDNQSFSLVDEGGRVIGGLIDSFRA